MSQDESNDDRTMSFIILAPGTEVLHYKIIEKIGAGGMGEVYLAVDIKLNRKVALKFLPPHLCQDEDCRKRFTREAQAAAALDHPNIAAIYEVGEYQNRPFYAMQVVEGRSLKKVIDDKDLSIDRIIEITIQVCEGLQAAHNKGIIHRDIKPSNILIDDHGRVRIVDFGLASIQGSEQLTKTGSTLGTIGYMSPEQVRGEDIDQRSDLFSLGVVLYELITRQNPFKRDSEAATLKAVSDDNPQPAARYRADLPDGIQPILDKALDKDTKTRYQHADDLRADLLQLKRSLDSSNSIITATRTLHRPTYFWLILTSVIIVFTGISIFFYMRSGHKYTIVTPEFRKVTNSGSAYYGVISPDGTYYAYSSKNQDKLTMTVYVSDFDGQQAIKLFEGDYVEAMRWSPDGKELIIRAHQSGDPDRIDVFLIPRLGGQFRRFIVPGTADYYWDLSWMPDGKRFITIADANRIILTDKQTGDTTAIPLSIGFQDVEFGGVTGNGRWLVFIGYSDSLVGVFAADIGNGQVHRIAEGFFSGPTLSPSNDAIYAILGGFGPNSNRIVRLKFNAVTGECEGQYEILVSGLPVSLGLTVPKDGKRILMRQLRVSSNLIAADIQQGSDYKQVHRRQLTFGTGWVKNPSISPDGKLIAYSAEDNGTFQIFVIPSAGGESIQLTHRGIFNTPPVWSPSGEQIAFFSLDSLMGKADSLLGKVASHLAFVYAERTGSMRYSSLNWGISFEADCMDWTIPNTIVISHGQRIAPICVNVSTGDTSSLECEPLKDRLCWTHYSPDGRYIAVSPGREVWIYSFEDKKARFLITANAYTLGWSKDSKWVQYLTKDRVVAKTNIESGKTDTLSILPDMDWFFDGTAVAISPDESFLVYELGQIQRDLYLIENFDPHVK